MIPLVDVAPAAEENALARQLAAAVRDNVELGGFPRRDFAALRGSLAVVSEDTGEATTLRFDHGRLVVHDGVIGVPDATLRGPRDAIEALTALPFSRRAGIPFARLSDRDGVAALRRALRVLSSRRLRVYGLWLHMPFLARAVRVLSRRA